MAVIVGAIDSRDAVMTDPDRCHHDRPSRWISGTRQELHGSPSSPARVGTSHSRIHRHDQARSRTARGCPVHRARQPSSESDMGQLRPLDSAHHHIPCGCDQGLFVSSRLIVAALTAMGSSAALCIQVVPSAHATTWVQRAESSVTEILEDYRWDDELITANSVRLSMTTAQSRSSKSFTACVPTNILDVTTPELSTMIAVGVPTMPAPTARAPCTSRYSFKFKLAESITS